MERVAAYIDGFNLYHGMKEFQGRRYLWLNLRTFCELLLTADQELIDVKYFTARADHMTEESRSRQKLFLRALREEAGIEPIVGKFIHEPNEADQDQGNHVRYKWTEKMTDVKLAVALLADAYNDLYDAALLVSADSDLSPAASAITQPPLMKRLHVRFPPARSCKGLRKVAHSCEEVEESVYDRSQLPDPVVTREGKAFNRPELWH